jgi:LysM repeat protein
MDDMTRRSIATVLQAQLAGAGYTDITVTVKPNGTCVIAGEVANSEEEQEVTDLVESSGLDKVQLRLEVSEDDEGDEEEEDEEEDEEEEDEEDDEEEDEEEEDEEEEDEEEEDEEEQTDTVRKGDSYWKISEMFYGHGRYHQMIREANGDREVIHPGDELVIPALDGGDEEEEEEEGDEGEEQTYTVRKGDSYWKISEMFYGHGRYHQKIREANGDREVIHPGDELVIPALDEE